MYFLLEGGKRFLRIRKLIHFTGLDYLEHYMTHKPPQGYGSRQNGWRRLLKLPVSCSEFGDTAFVNHHS